MPPVTRARCTARKFLCTSVHSCRRGVGGDRRWNAPLHEAHSDRSGAPRRPCGAPQASAATKTVQIQRGSFSPATVSIVAGDTIRWRNADTRDHQVVSTTGTFASPVLRPGRTYSFTFDARSYRYRDALHPRVTGTVRVAWRAAGPDARHLAAADLLRREGDPERPGQQQARRRAGPDRPPALRPGSQLVLATVLTGVDGTFSLPRNRRSDDLPGALEDGAKPRDHDRRRAVDLVRPAQRLRHLFAGRSMARKQVQLQRLSSWPVGHDQAGLARPRLARPLPRRRCRSVFPACGSRCR